jgi:hypothetical protein
MYNGVHQISNKIRIIARDIEDDRPELSLALDLINYELGSLKVSSNGRSHYAGKTKQDREQFPVPFL